MRPPKRQRKENEDKSSAEDGAAAPKLVRTTGEEMDVHGEEGERRGEGFERDPERGERFHGGGRFEKTYDEVLHQTSPDNTTVCVGQIGSLTEDEIRRAFNRFGVINEVRIFKLQGYAFVKFEQKEPAARAIVQMNNTEIMGQMVRCKWEKSGDDVHVDMAVGPNETGDSNRKMDYSRHFHVFVGDLCSEIDSTKLREAFIQFGDVSEAKIIRDKTTKDATRYGIVSYTRKEDAEKAIELMNGKRLGKRTIRTDWASRKPGVEGERRQGGGSERDPDGVDSIHGEKGLDKTSDKVLRQTSADNTSVYIEPIGSLTEDKIRRAFNRFGVINEVRIFKLQGYALVKFEKKEPAARAIVQMNNTEIMGQMVRCNWEKSGDTESSIPLEGSPINSRRIDSSNTLSLKSQSLDELTNFNPNSSDALQMLKESANELKNLISKNRKLKDHQLILKSNRSLMTCAQATQNLLFHLKMSPEVKRLSNEVESRLKKFVSKQRHVVSQVSIVAKKHINDQTPPSTQNTIAIILKQNISELMDILMMKERNSDDSMNGDTEKNTFFNWLKSEAVLKRQNFVNCLQKDLKILKELYSTISSCEQICGDLKNSLMKSDIGEGQSGKRVDFESIGEDAGIVEESPVIHQDLQENQKEKSYQNNQKMPRADGDEEVHQHPKIIVSSVHGSISSDAAHSTVTKNPHTLLESENVIVETQSNESPMPPVVVSESDSTDPDLLASIDNNEVQLESINPDADTGIIPLSTLKSMCDGSWRRLAYFYRSLQQKTFDYCMKWNDSGEEFFIKKDSMKLISEKFHVGNQTMMIRKSKICSFAVGEGEEFFGFRHPFFRRDCVNDLKRIKKFKKGEEDDEEVDGSEGSEHSMDVHCGSEESIDIDSEESISFEDEEMVEEEDSEEEQSDDE